MPTTLFEPWRLLGRLIGLSADAIVAVPSQGATLFRLVTHDPPELEDFQPPRPLLAEKKGFSEIERAALSHFLQQDQAETLRWKASQNVARVVIPAHPRIHLARTDQEVPGHVDVWVPSDLVEILLPDAEVVG